MELTIVIPCLNEADTLERCIKKSQKFLEDHQVIGEVIVADNGSNDGSQAIAVKSGAKLVQVESRGYGNVLIGGIHAASGKYIIMGDADDSYDFLSLNPFLDKLRDGYDLVMGNRFLGGIQPGAMPFLHRYFGNPILSWIGRLFFNSPCRDFHCGLRGFSKRAISEMDLKTTGMEFASEMVVKATLLKMKIAEVPTTLSPDGRSRAPHLRSWRDGWRHLRFLLLYSPRWLFLYPGLVLMIIGSLMVVYILPAPKMVMGILFDLPILIYGSIMIMVGFEAISFAVFTRTFAMIEGLHPKDDYGLTFLYRYISLEVGLMIGFALVTLGSFQSLYGAKIWTKIFDLNTLSVRSTILSVLLLVLGFQIILSSFFMSVLGLKRK